MESPAHLRFSVLGPLRGWRGDRELDLGPPQQRLVLALLLVRAGGHVNSLDFVELLWEGEAPASGLNSVHRYIGALRRLLEPRLASRSPGQRLLRYGDSYQLSLPHGSIDLLDFRQSVTAARRATHQGQFDFAVSHYITALQLHHGHCVPTGGGARHSAFMAVDQEVALVAREAAEAALAAHQASALLPALRLIAELNPLDEALQAQLMMLLAADGKQSEALGVYRDRRAELAGELGVDPGSELRGAHDQVLRMTPVSAPPQAPLRPGTGFVDGSRPISVTDSADPPHYLIRPAQLPHELCSFTGRSQELNAARFAVDRWQAEGVGSGVGVVDGMPGVGKTAFAVRLAHELAGDFPDGQIYLDLHGFGTEAMVTPAAALRIILRTLGVSTRGLPNEVTTLAALYRSVLADKRLLVLLDNARDAAQVRMLLPGGRSSFVLVTSRQRLTNLSIIGSAYRLTLDLPTPQDAREGLLRRVGVQLSASTADAAAVSVAADQIVDNCQRLPLALAIVAARVDGRPGRLFSVASELQNSASSLDALVDHGGTDLRTVFSWSYRILTTPAARLFRILAEHVFTDFSLARAAGLAGLKPQETSHLLDELTHAHLLVDRGPERYRYHDLVRQYARGLTPNPV